MRSFHVACAALGAIGSTLAAVAVLANPSMVLETSYDRAIAATAAPSRADLAAAARAPGSEHFWLTRSQRDRHIDNAAGPQTPIAPLLAAVPSPSLADLKHAVAAVGDADAEAIEILAVQDVPRATIGAAAPVGRAMLVTARIGAGDHQPGRIVRFVFDAVGAPTPARAL